MARAWVVALLLVGLSGAGHAGDERVFILQVEPEIGIKGGSKPVGVAQEDEAVPSVATRTPAAVPRARIGARGNLLPPGVDVEAVEVFENPDPRAAQPASPGVMAIPRPSVEDGAPLDGGADGQ